MMIVPVIKFPVIGISSPRKAGQYAFVAASLEEMCETPLHAYLGGMLKKQYFVDASFRRFEATNMRLAGLDIARMRQVGIGAALVSGLFSGLNLPVLVSFDLVESEVVDLETLRTTLVSCLESYPRYYTLRLKQQKAAEKLRHARDVAELAAALS